MSPRIISLITAIAALTVCHAAALAQWNSDPAVNTALVVAGNEQVQSKIALAPDGGSFVSWFDNRAGGYDPYLQKLNREGVPQWAANGVLVYDRAVSSTEDYGLSVDAGGNAVLAYGTVNYSQMGAQKLDPNGNLLWGPNGILFATPGGSHFPKAASTSDGHHVVGWIEGLNIVLHRLDAAGNDTWGPGGVILSDPPMPTSRAYQLCDIQPGDKGSVLVSWARCSGANCITSNRHIYIQKLDTAGVPQWNGGNPVIVFNNGTLAPQSFPSFIHDGSGGAVLGWFENGADFLAYVQHLDSVGVEMFPHNGVAATVPTVGRRRISAGVSYSPASGEIFLGWTEVTLPTQNMWGVRAQRFNASGVRQWGDEGISVQALNENQSSFVQTVALEDGCVVHWFDARSISTGVVLSARLDESGAQVWPVSPLESCSRDSSKARLASAIDPCGMSILAWSDGGSGEHDLFVQNVWPGGQLGPRSVVGGDVNCDFVVDSADLPIFVEALLDPASHATIALCCNLSNADLNGDMQINGDDCAGFVAALLP